jgi:hypothetical protein
MLMILILDKDHHTKKIALKFLQITKRNKEEILNIRIMRKKKEKQMGRVGINLMEVLCLIF